MLQTLDKLYTETLNIPILFLSGPGKSVGTRPATLLLEGFGVAGCLGGWGLGL